MFQGESQVRALAGEGKQQGDLLTAPPCARTLQIAGSRRVTGSILAGILRTAAGDRKGAEKE